MSVTVTDLLMCNLYRLCFAPLVLPQHTVFKNLPLKPCWDDYLSLYCHICVYG